MKFGVLVPSTNTSARVAGARVLRDRLLAKSDGRVGMTLGADAILAALRRYGGIRRIGVVTPYMPIGDETARRFFTECGFEAVRVQGLPCSSPVLIAHTSKAALRDAIIAVDGPMSTRWWWSAPTCQRHGWRAPRNSGSASL